MLRAFFRKNENTQEWMHYGAEAVSQLSELIEFNSNPANKNAYGDSICAYIRIEAKTPMEAQEFWTSVGHELLSEFNITIEYFAMKCYYENGHANLFIEDLLAFAEYEKKESLQDRIEEIDRDMYQNCL